ICGCASLRLEYLCVASSSWRGSVLAASPFSVYPGFSRTFVGGGEQPSSPLHFAFDFLHSGLLPGPPSHDRVRRSPLFVVWFPSKGKRTALGFQLAKRAFVF